MEKSPAVSGERPEYRPVAIDKKTVTAMFPIEKEAKIPTMDRPLIVESACPGWQIGGARFPAVPISLADQIQEQTDSVRAGAIAVHIHPRDPKTGEAQMNPGLLKEVLDGIFSNVGDCIAVTHSWYPVPNSEVDYITETEKLFEMGEGNKYVQGAIVIPIGYYTRSMGSHCSPRATIEGVKWMEAHDIKPIYQLHDTYSHLGFKHYLFDEGISTWKPYQLNVNLGKHDSHAVHQDPWSYLQLITNVNTVKATIPESTVGLNTGGRNWLPILTMGILMGVEYVRVGIEDCYWLYPHRDEIIKKNSDVVKMVVEIATMLGRRVVTDANEARQILGMKLTSKL
jgi:uncharacterized protein (DUF849 family)